MARNTRLLVGVGLAALIVGGGIFFAMNREQTQPARSRVVLECDPPAALEEASGTIGITGGAIVTASGNKFDAVPFGQWKREITLRQLPERALKVELTAVPSGNFLFHPKLEIALGRCSAEQIESRDWAIYRLDAGGQPDERLKTTIENGIASARIKHNSKYAIAD
jgi:hypothetical protein